MSEEQQPKSDPNPKQVFEDPGRSSFDALNKASEKLRESLALNDENLKARLAHIFKDFDQSLAHPPRIDFDASLFRTGGSNEHLSAATLIRRLEATIGEWKTKLPDGCQPGMSAILNNGAAIQVSSMSQEGFNGIRIDGYVDGQPCMLLTHQSALQILCYVEQATQPARSIGFHYSGDGGGT